jgi:hypothetical protein
MSNADLTEEKTAKLLGVTTDELEELRKNYGLPGPEGGPFHEPSVRSWRQHLVDCGKNGPTYLRELIKWCRNSKQSVLRTVDPSTFGANDLEVRIDSDAERRILDADGGPVELHALVDRGTYFPELSYRWLTFDGQVLAVTEIRNEPPYLVIVVTPEETGSATFL